VLKALPDLLDILSTVPLEQCAVKVAATHTGPVVSATP
jgi:hypothetical protein